MCASRCRRRPHRPTVPNDPLVRLSLAVSLALSVAGCGGETEGGRGAGANATGGSQAGGAAFTGGEGGQTSVAGAPGSGGGSGGAVQLSSVVANALDHCALSPTGNPETMEMVVPQELTGSPWGVLDSICHSGGFDLALCAGSTAELTSISIDQTPYTARVVTVGEQLCCVYKDWEEATPGLAAATCGPVYPTVAAMSRCQIIANPDDPQQTLEQVTVPSSPSQDPLWAARDAVCSEGGYDLSSCAGNQATLVTVLENTFIVGNPEPIKGWILTMGNTVCCIWETDGAATPSLLAKTCTR